MAQKKFYKNVKKETYITPDAPQAILDMLVSEAGFHPKTLEVFQKGGVKTVGEVASRNARQLFKLQGFNKKSLADCEKVLAVFGLSVAPDASGEVKCAENEQQTNVGAVEGDKGEPRKKKRPKADYVPPVSAEISAIRISDVQSLCDRTKNALIKRNIITFGDLAMKTARDLFFIKEMGKSGNAECVALLAEYGLSTRPVEEYEPQQESKESRDFKVEKEVKKEKNIDTGAEKTRFQAQQKPQDKVNQPQAKQAEQKQRPDKVEKHSEPVSHNEHDERDKHQKTDNRVKRESERRQQNEELPELRKYCSAGKYGYKNSKGDVVIPPVYDEIAPFKEGYAAVEVNELFGYINEKNEMVVEPQYECAMSFSEGLACVTRYGKSGYINTSGEVVIPFKYDAGTAFENGSSRVKADNHWGELTPDGEVRWIK